MGLLSGVGPKLRGLFGNDDLGDAFAQARAFLNGDYGTGIDIAGRRFQRRRRGSALDAAKEREGGMTGTDPDEAAALGPPVGTIKDGHRYLGGDPRQPGSWQPLDGTAVGSGAAMQDDLGRW